MKITDVKFPEGFKCSGRGGSSDITKYPRDFEIIIENKLARLKVPGGWFIIFETKPFKLEFLHDINHEWILEED